MSKRTSVLIEVEDDVYDSLVAPLKRNKSFAKLVSSLLNGYITDGYIRSFIDDSLDDVRKAVVDSFGQSVEEMEQLLSNMGILSDELESHARAGHHKFRQRGEQQAQEVGSQGFASRPSDSSVEDLRSKVDSLEQLVNDGFAKIINILGTASVSQPTVSVAEEGVHLMPTEAFVDHPSQRGLDDLGAIDEVAEEDGEVPSGEAVSFLSSLVADIGLSF